MAVKLIAKLLTSTHTKSMDIGGKPGVVDIVDAALTPDSSPQTGLMPQFIPLGRWYPLVITRNTISLLREDTVDAKKTKPLQRKSALLMDAKLTAFPKTSNLTTSRDTGGKHGVVDIADAAPMSIDLPQTGLMLPCTKSINNTNLLLIEDTVEKTHSQKLKLEILMIARLTVVPLIKRLTTSKDIGGKHGEVDIVDVAPMSIDLPQTGLMLLSTDLVQIESIENII